MVPSMTNTTDADSLGCQIGFLALLRALGAECMNSISSVDSMQ